MESKLYIVPTPIGNMRDITLRALDVLTNVCAVACEDPRVTLKIFNHYKIKAPRMLKCTEYSTDKEVARILDCLGDGDVALTSNAGTPLISDPGHALVARAVECGITVVPLAGCSSIITALAGSCKRNSHFVFVGFMPKSLVEKKAVLKMYGATKASIVIFENGKRLASTLKIIHDVLHNPFIEIARELTKINESFVRGMANEVISAIDQQVVKGEIVIIVNCSAQTDVERKQAMTDDDIMRALASGLSVRTILESHGHSAKSRKELYSSILSIKKTLDNYDRNCLKTAGKHPK